MTQPLNIQYLQSGLNLIQEAITIFDADLKLVACNSRFVDMFQLPDALSNIGTGYLDILRYLANRGEYGDIENIEAFLEERADQALAFEPHYIERVRANGETISIEGHPLAQGGWVTVYTDITEIKRKESLLEARSDTLREQISNYVGEISEANRELRATVTALEETKRQLIASEERIRLALDHAPAHIAQIDANLKYRYTNGGLSRLMPDMPSDLVGKTVSEIWGDDSAGRLVPALQQALKGERPVIEFTHKPDGRRLRVAFTPLQSESRNDIESVNVLTLDVTEETIARETVSQASRRATAAMMVSGLAHDFANLLLIIQSAQSKLARQNLDANAQEPIDVTLKAAERGRALIKRISQVTTSGDGKPEPVDIGAVLGELDYFVKPILRDGISLEIETESAPLDTMIDRGGLVDCFVNLILNAQDAILAQNPSGTISIRAHETRNKIQIHIRDDGPGFTDEALENGFLPFFTTNPNAGSGLGLSMVYDLVKRAGGLVTLHNHETGGAVHIELQKTFAHNKTTKGRALLVENDAVLRSETRQILRKLGFTVDEASNAEDAIEGFGDDRFALVLTDIDLGGKKTGLDVAAHFARRAHVIVASALPASHPLRKRAENEFYFLSKPITGARLAQLIKVNK